MEIFKGLLTFLGFGSLLFTVFGAVVMGIAYLATRGEKSTIAQDKRRDRVFDGAEKFTPYVTEDGKAIRNEADEIAWLKAHQLPVLT